MIRVVLAALLVLSAGRAQAECRASASGRRSVSVALSALSGGGCFHDVSVHTGPSCEGAPELRVTLGCSETRRMVVTDEGALVSLLADRASRREWEIVRVFVRDGERIAVRSVRLDELPGLPPDARRPRLSLDARVLTIDGERAVEVAALATLGRVTARRRLR